MPTLALKHLPLDSVHHRLRAGKHSPALMKQRQAAEQMLLLALGVSGGGGVSPTPSEALQPEPSSRLSPLPLHLAAAAAVVRQMQLLHIKHTQI